VTTIVVEGSREWLGVVLAGLGADAPDAVTVSDEAGAARALWAALRGEAQVIHATASRPVLDRLYDDLRRLGPVVVRSELDARGPGPDGLAGDERALLGLLSTGLSLREAAVRLHLSPRTADRRLAHARSVLGVATTAEAVQLVARRD
jgi:DNA-binding CsgD family transcriptional regulator